MEIVEEAASGATVVKPLRRVDSSNAKMFEERVMTAMNGGAASVVIDFESVDYISSAGLRVIMMAAKASKAKNRKVILCAMKPTVREVFVVSGLTKVLTIVETRQAALGGG